MLSVRGVEWVRERETEKQKERREWKRSCTGGQNWKSKRKNQWPNFEEKGLSCAIRILSFSLSFSLSCAILLLCLISRREIDTFHYKARGEFQMEINGSTTGYKLKDATHRERKKREKENSLCSLREDEGSDAASRTSSISICWSLVSCKRLRIRCSCQMSCLIRQWLFQLIKYN